jgi:hypothetical protein
VGHRARANLHRTFRRVTSGHAVCCLRRTNLQFVRLLIQLRHTQQEATGKTRITQTNTDAHARATRPDAFQKLVGLVRSAIGLWQTQR